MRRRRIIAAAAAGLVASGAIAAGIEFAGADGAASLPTTTPIKHVVVLFDENISFDHYFGTYPHATNPAGESQFTAAPDTPTINGLTQNLLTNNPNAANPTRFDPQDLSSLVTCDNNHNYSPEQKAFYGGLMDQFVANTTGSGCSPANEVMDYYDGNTVTGLWNLAQHFSMSDNSFGTGFGPSTPGALELVSGNTTGIVDDSGNPIATAAGVDNNTAYANQYPFPDFDGCTSASASNYAASFATSGANQHKNIGDLMNSAGVSWGWFQGGFTPTSRLAPTATFPDGQPVCASAHNNIAHVSQTDYDAHHNPFAYYRSTANPLHLPPSSITAVGSTDQANHQYDLSTFDQALAQGVLPAVSFLKASHYQDGHAGYSDPIDEQKFIVDEVNAIEASPFWSSTAIVIAYDDSDGWYDHAMATITQGSDGPSDQLGANGWCGLSPIRSLHSRLQQFLPGRVCDTARACVRPFAHGAVSPGSADASTRWPNSSCLPIPSPSLPARRTRPPPRRNGSRNSIERLHSYDLSFISR